MDSAKNFDVFMPTKILFGPGRAAELGDHAAQYGKRAMLVTYRDIRGLEETIEKAAGYLEDAGLSVTRYSEVEPDPPVEIINRGAEIARDSGAEVMVGLGGGSAIDASKAIAVVAMNGGDAWDYVACNPDKKEFSSSLPTVAVPTTAGTGSEVTPVAVLTNKKIKSKGSIVAPPNIPKIAMVDPELMRSMPPGLTASTGVDALGHAQAARQRVRNRDAPGHRDRGLRRGADGDGVGDRDERVGSEPTADQLRAGPCRCRIGHRLRPVPPAVRL